MKNIMLIISAGIVMHIVSFTAQADTATTTTAPPQSPTEQLTTTPTPTNPVTPTPTQSDQSTNTSSPTIPTTPQAANPKPCHAIKAACKAAGYFVGGEKLGKSLKGDCIKPLLSGQSVNGVTVNPADIPACLAKHHAN